MHLFYSPEITSNTFTLNQEESKHCLKVLRLNTGDVVHLTDGKGNLYQTTIIDANPKKCTLEIREVKKEYGKKDYKIHMAVAPTKNINRFEWFLEKATEIGIDKITPVICEHSERRIINPERLNKVIIAAMKQSFKAYLPVLNPAIFLKDFISEKNNSEKYIAYCSDNYRDNLKDLYNKQKDAVILIGPEGDFSEQEVSLAINYGFKPISLGAERLRTETAALVACHTVNLINL